MLLFVVRSDLDDRKYAGGVRRRHLPDQPLDRCVDMRSIGSDIRSVRTGDQASLRPGMTRAGRDIIGVEKKRKSLIENPVIRIIGNQQKLLEEPCDVCAMPFSRTRVRHRLDDLVLWREI